MGKARKYGARTAYVPNAKADARYKKKFFERGKEFADNAEERNEERKQKRFAKEMERMKRRWNNGENRTD